MNNKLQHDFDRISWYDTVKNYWLKWDNILFLARTIAEILLIIAVLYICAVGYDAFYGSNVPINPYRK